MPELLVADLEASLRFWCGLLGFSVLYRRPEEGFAYLEQGRAQIMLEQRNERARQWITAPLEPPLGRGVNFQIAVSAAAPVLAALERHGWPLFEDLEEKWYRAGDAEAGQRQFLVKDPDGYLVRMAEDLGTRAFV